jgi:hypothetical protein
LFYQYLFTLEAFFSLIDQRWPEQTEVRIEDPDDKQICDPHIVDFSVYHPRDGLCTLYQAKSVVVPDTSKMSAAAALPILIRMATSADCPEYKLITNAQPGHGLAALNKCLASGLPALELREQLSQIARRSIGATEALASLTTSSKVDQLRRCSVEACGQAASVLRERIVGSIAKWRADHGLPLGPLAAPILESHLINEVFSRAAGTVRQGTAGRYRTVTLAEFQKLLAPPADLLAQAAAKVESGDGIEHVPNGGGVQRPKLLQHLAQRFSSVRSGTAQLCAITGPSGVGKTRLAAMYAHRERSAYDRVCWIDAESDASVIASILTQQRAIGISDAFRGDPDKLSVAFRKCVSTFIGRWLIVFDNARSARAIQRWVAYAGNAHVLVTSTNSADWTQFGRVDVDGMEPDQGLELLNRSLKNDMQTASAELRTRAEDALIRLALKLEWRPLALQIAAAHFESVSALVQGIDVYTATIEHLAEVMDDDTLDRGGYPRTLQAAINICLDRLGETTTSAAGATAIGMLNASAVLGSRSIPALLAFSVATVPAEAVVDAPGSRAGLHEQLPLLNSAIHKLRRDSLIERRNATAINVPRELEMRLDINEIVQHVIRKRIDVTAAINVVAAHVSSWMGVYIDQQDFAAAAALQPHARVLLELAKGRAGEDLPLCTTLAGNQATLLDMQGRSDLAIGWLQFELEIISNLSTPQPKLKTATETQLAAAMMQIGAPLSRILPVLESAVRGLDELRQAGDLNFGGDRHCHNLLQVVQVFLRQGGMSRNQIEHLKQIRHRIQTLQTIFPASDLVNAYALYEDVERALDTSQHRDVLDASADLPQDIREANHALRIKNRAQRIEALAACDDYGRAQSELRELIEDHRRHPQIVAGLCQSLLNTGARIAFGAICGFGSSATGTQLLRGIIRFSGALRTNEHERCMHALLAAHEASSVGDVHGVKTLLEIAAAHKPANRPGVVKASVDQSAELMTLLHYWVECAQMGVEAKAAEAAVIRRAVAPLGDRRLVHMEVIAPDLAGELQRYAQARTFNGRWRPDIMREARVLEVIEVSGRPAFCLLFNVTGSHTGDPKDQDPFVWRDGTQCLPDSILLSSSPGAAESIRVDVL